MGKLIFITGGARSGKSSYAEKLAERIEGDILYVATSIPFDDEMKDRVKKHRERRPQNWATLETYKNFDVKLPEKLEGKAGVLFDCVTNMVSNLMLEKVQDDEVISPDKADKVQGYIESEVNKLMKVIHESSAVFIMVTNEVGMSLVPEYALGRLFRDAAGIINQRIAEKADEVYLCVSGIPVKIK